jgi:tetratricopeptide (TPR) repeat protein
MGRVTPLRDLLRVLLPVGLAAGLAAPGLAQEPAPAASGEPAEQVAAGREGLEPVPAPGAETERLAAAEREQLTRQHEIVDAMLAAGDRFPDADLANAFGRLGQLYYAYDLLRPAAIAFSNAVALDPDQFGWHYYLAAMHTAEGELEDALRELDRVLELRPEDLPSLARRGRILLDLGRVEEAEEAFGAVLELDPDSAAAHHGLGEVRYEQGRLDEAIERFERALELQPEANALHYKLGLAYRKAGDMDRAREHLTLNRSGEVVFPDPLIAVLDRFLHGSRPHVKAGNRAMEAGDLEQAAEHYREAVEADAEDALAQYNLGFVLARLGRREEAESRFRRAIELDPDYRNAHFNLASTLAEQGRWEEAAEHYRRSYEIDAEDRLAHLEWARALVALGRTEEAEDALRQVIGETRSYERPIAAEAHALLAALLEGRGLPAEAAEHYRRAAELDPESVSAHRGLAGLLGRQGRFGDAAGHLERVVELEPENVEARFGRSMALIFGERYADARRALEADLAAVGEAPPLVHLLARLLATSPEPSVRDGELALKLAVHAFRQQGSLDRIETVAMAWAEAGNFEHAVEWEQRAVNIAERRGRHDVAERARSRLAALRRGEPIRSPWRREAGLPTP